MLITNPGTEPADGTAPYKHANTHSKNGWMERREGREACSVHAESDLTLSLPDGKSSVVTEAGDHSTC